MTDRLILLTDGRWARFSPDARLIASGDGKTRPEDAEQATTILIVPGCDVRLTRLDLPAGTALQRAALARHHLAETFAEPAEAVHVAVGPAHEAAGASPVAVAGRAQMDDWMAAHGAPDHIIPAPLLLVEEDDAIWSFESRLIVRSGPHIFEAEPALAQTLLGTDLAALPARSIDAAALMQRAARLGPSHLDLRQGAYARKSPPIIDCARMRLLAQLAGVAATAALLAALVSLWRLSSAADAIDAQILAETAAALPQARRIVNPQAQLREALAKHGSTRTSALAPLVALTAAIESSADIRLHSVEYDAGRPLRAALVMTGTANLEALTPLLLRSGYELREGAMQPVPDGRRVEIELEHR